jgi:urease subunit gamma
MGSRVPHIWGAAGHMDLSPREIDKLYVYQVAELARRRRDRGTKLNVSEAQALVTEAILEGARDGRTVAECMELGKKVVTEAECMDGVRERITLLQVEATFVDGTKLVSCHDPIGA